MACNCKNRDDLIAKMVDIWRNVKWSSPEEKKEANRRVKICLTSGKDGDLCPSNHVLYCRQCNIWIPAKARSMVERCPIGKWDK